jgi:hypothetical protein
MKIHNRKPELYLQESRPLGKSWGEWIELWWRWCYSEPEDKSPIEDYTGELISKNQNYSNAWFLGGTFGGKCVRIGTVPMGKAILFPILTNLITFGEYPKLDNETQLWAYAKADLDTATVIGTTIDGTDLQNLKNYRIQSNVFSLRMPINTSNGIVIKITKGVSDGYWAFLKHLPAGLHTISIYGEKALYDNVQYGGYKGEDGKFKTKVTYSITVK